MQKVKILDVQIDNLTRNQSLDLINNFIVSKRPKQIVTVNPEFIMAAQKDQEFMKILNNADLSVADGSGLLFASRFLLRNPINEKVTGIDLFWSILELATKNRYSIFLLGGENGSGAKTAQVLKNKYPHLIIAGTYEGFPVLEQPKSKSYKDHRLTDIKSKVIDQNIEIIQKIRKAKPDVLFVAYGAPKQDKFIARYKKALNVPVMIGVGGTFDFVSGKVKRAPKWMQKFWLEWVWRLFNQPKRWNRIYIAAIKFPIAVIINKLTKSA